MVILGDQLLLLYSTVQINVVVVVVVVVVVGKVNYLLWGGAPRSDYLNLQAKLRVPISDWSSCRVVDRWDWKLERADLILSTLSSGSLISTFPESSMIPMN